MLAAGAVDHHPLDDVSKEAVRVVLRARQLGADITVNYGRVQEPVAVVGVEEEQEV